MYKLTKGNISKIRQAKKDASKMIDEGWKLDGECDKNFNIINPYPDMSDAKRSHAKKTETKKIEEKSEA